MTMSSSDKTTASRRLLFGCLGERNIVMHCPNASVYETRINRAAASGNCPLNGIAFQARYCAQKALRDMDRPITTISV